MRDRVEDPRLPSRAEIEERMSEEAARRFEMRKEAFAYRDSIDSTHEHFGVVEVTLADGTVFYRLEPAFRPTEDVAQTPEFITPTGLKRRGWKPLDITRLLGEPDRTAPNPRFRTAARMRLYRLTRVEAAEAEQQEDRTK